MGKGEDNSVGEEKTQEAWHPSWFKTLGTSVRHVNVGLIVSSHLTFLDLSVTDL